MAENLERLARLGSASILAILLSFSAAEADGSIRLNEVMEQLKHDAALISELKAELKKQDLKPVDVVCTGSRFGNHWTQLGGVRTVPFECEIGTRRN
jgi:hypothetical protein